MSILVNDSAEMVQPAYGEAFELVGLKGLGSGSQGLCLPKLHPGRSVLMCALYVTALGDV